MGTFSVPQDQVRRVGRPKRVGYLALEGESLASHRAALMDRVMRTITGPVERYEAAQKALFEVLLKE